MTDFVYRQTNFRSCDLSRVGTEKSSEPNLVNLQPPTTGDEIGFASSILFLDNKSPGYFDLVRMR